MLYCIIVVILCCIILLLLYCDKILCDNQRQLADYTVCFMCDYSHIHIQNMWIIQKCVFVFMIVCVSVCMCNAF